MKCIQAREGPSSGLLRDYEPSDGTFSSTSPHSSFFMMLQFYLAFENSLCGDYITEKFWKVLSYNVVPVVLNGVNMTRVAPPHSYIDIKDFATVEGDTIITDQTDNPPSLSLNH